MTITTIDVTKIQPQAANRQIDKDKVLSTIRDSSESAYCITLENPGLDMAKNTIVSERFAKSPFRREVSTKELCEPQSDKRNETKMLLEFSPKQQQFDMYKTTHDAKNVQNSIDV